MIVSLPLGVCPAKGLHQGTSVCDWRRNEVCSEALGTVFFFFSSRRRHTRFDCDWSSDVCSSDLCPDRFHRRQRTRRRTRPGCGGPTRGPRRAAGPRRGGTPAGGGPHSRTSAARSEEHTSELQSQSNLVCPLLLEKKKNKNIHYLL